jgi:hypothetical protein
MQQFLKSTLGTAGAEVIPSELFEQFLIPMHKAMASSHVGFGWISPSSVCYSSRKQGRLSKSLSRTMSHLLNVSPSTAIVRADEADDYRRVGRWRGAGTRSIIGTAANKRMQLTSRTEAGRSPRWLIFI